MISDKIITSPEGFILKPFWYYLISFTWGLSVTLVGYVIAGFLLLCGYEAKKNIYGWYFEIGSNWGGADFGMICLVNKNPSRHLLNHEFGHSIQNCIFGPLTWFFVMIPSVIRYWLRIFWEKNIEDVKLPPYDYAWFEQQASMFGDRYYARVCGED